MKKLIGIVVLLAGLTACTAQERAKNFGGTYVENLRPGNTLVNVTWKDDHLWILVRGRNAGETPRDYWFDESSSYGIMQGHVHLIEH